MNYDLDGLSPRVREAADCARRRAEGAWDRIDDAVFSNQKRVLDAFIRERVSLTHLWPSTGYGYGDEGRSALERVYARVFGAEAALVRMHWASGTHVLKTALHGLLRPGDGLLSVTGRPYETVMPILKSLSSDWRVSYKESSCLLEYQSGRLAEDGLERALSDEIGESTRVMLVQRSRGYSARQSLNLGTIETLSRIVRRRWPHVVTLVDNCYCEFVQSAEPPSVGADLAVGSLIKNPGGGICPTGGYVAGRRDCVRKVAEALYAPGLGDEVGSNPYGYRDMFQGLFMAPKTVGQALKGAVFASAFFRELGLDVDPEPSDERFDIVQAVTLGSAERLSAFASCIQHWSPVDSFAEPEPWDMPGYEHKIIMAAGTFVQGSSIELSCDAPFVPPYTAYLQGGLSKEHVILACLMTGQALADRALI
mgnify:CR=1 FL=1